MPATTGSAASGYAADASQPQKQAQARQILLTTANIVVSTQVINEFYAVATRKLKPPLPEHIAAQVAENMGRYTCVTIDADLVARAVRAGQRWQLSHWDALTVEAARQAACDRVLSEGLAKGLASGGSTFDGVHIENPFVGAA
jgi:predicted nucleic acid-binding protein